MVGELAAQCNANDIEDIREKMRVKTGLVIVGGADDQLRLTNRKKKAELVTQAMVDKSIIEQVRSFLATVLMKQSQAAAEKGKYLYVNVQLTIYKPPNPQNLSTSHLLSRTRKDLVKR